MSDDAPPIKCSADPPRRCAQRFKAQQDGEIFYSYVHGGWLWLQGPPMQRMDKIEQRHPFVFTWCPWCQGDLPNATSAVKRLLEPPPPTPFTQADGEGPEA